MYGSAEKALYYFGTQKILQEFSDLLDAVSSSVENDGDIDAKEAKRIRREWEDLKRITESFVVACERGVYAEAPD